MDYFSLARLGAAGVKVLKASKGVYDSAVIFKAVRGPLAMMGISGIADAACEEIEEKVISMVNKEKK